MAGSTSRRRFLGTAATAPLWLGAAARCTGGTGGSSGGTSTGTTSGSASGATSGSSGGGSAATNSGTSSASSSSAGPGTAGETTGTAGDTGTAGTSMGGVGVCTQPPEVLIANNHPAAHSLVVPLADIEAGADKTYDIQGASAHPHTVTITAADFAALAAGQPIQMESSMDAGHTHLVSVVCG